MRDTQLGRGVKVKLDPTGWLGSTLLKNVELSIHRTKPIDSVIGSLS